MTIPNIIKLLPLEEQEKVDMINVYENGTKEQKNAIVDLAWKSYFAIYNKKVNDYANEEMREIQEGKDGSLDEQIYARALKKTSQEMNGEMDKTLQKTNLDIARNAMKQIMTEINAAKKKKSN